jgi:hypothetical protein
MVLVSMLARVSTGMSSVAPTGLSGSSFGGVWYVVGHLLGRGLLRHLIGGLGGVRDAFAHRFFEYPSHRAPNPGQGSRSR